MTRFASSNFFALAMGCLFLAACSSSETGLGLDAGDITVADLDGGAADGPAVKADKAPVATPDTAPALGDTAPAALDAAGDAPHANGDTAALGDAGKKDSGTPATDTAGATNQEMGAACGSDGACKSGFCANGFCCESRCNQSCRACSTALTGKANGTCQPQMDNTVCGTSRCVVTTLTSAPVCMGGACVVPNITFSCANSLRCDDAKLACRTSCTKNADCQDGTVCESSSGKCVAPKANGTVCVPAGNGQDCRSGICSPDGVCCNEKCNSGCESCTKAGKGGGPDGTCGAAVALANKPCGGTFCISRGSAYQEIAKKICLGRTCSTFSANQSMDPTLIGTPCTDTDPCTDVRCVDDQATGQASCLAVTCKQQGLCCCKIGTKMGCSLKNSCDQPQTCTP